MSIQLSTTDFQRLTRIVQNSPGFANVSARRHLVAGVLEGVPQANVILARLDLDGSPMAVAVEVVRFLSQFGQVAYRREALGVFLNYIEPLVSYEEQEFIAALFKRYPLYPFRGRDALVVGINQYPFLKDTLTSKAKHLTTPSADAEAIAQLLETHGNFRVKRFPASIIDGKLQVDPDKVVKTEELEAAILDLFIPESAKPPETALLFFAGHGLRKQLRQSLTQGFLATSDASPNKNLWGLSLRDLWDILQQSQVKQQIIWLDCCFAGELLNFNDTELGGKSLKCDRFLIAASRDYEVGYQQLDGKHGVLTGALLAGLNPHLVPEFEWITNLRLTVAVEQKLQEYDETTKIPQSPLISNHGEVIKLIQGRAKPRSKNQSLDANTINELVKLLRPFLEEEKHRRPFLVLALGTNAPVLQQISWGGAVASFIPDIVCKLVDYGEVAPGKQAIWALLECVRSQVGIDLQQRIDNLQQQIKEELTRKEDQNLVSTDKTRISKQISFISELRTRLISDKQVYDLSRNEEFAQFNFIGLKETPLSVDLVAFTKADGFTEKQIVDLGDKFFNITQIVSYDFGLKPGPRMPNGLLGLVFEDECPHSLIEFIKKQTKISHSERSAVFVSWVIDIKSQQIHTHNNPISLLPPVVIMENSVFPGLDYLKSFISSYRPQPVNKDININDLKPVNNQVSSEFSRLEERLEEIHKLIQAMPEQQSKYNLINAQRVQILDQLSTYIETGEPIPLLESNQTFESLFTKNKFSDYNLTYYVAISTAPMLVSVGTDLEITISLNSNLSDHQNTHVIKIIYETAVDNELNIILNAPGLQLNGDNTASLPLDPDTAQEIQTAHFRLTALRPGSATITAEIYRGDTFETKLETQIQVANIDEVSFTPQRITAQPRPVPQPDFILRIQTIWNENNSTCKFQYQLKSFRFPSVFPDNNIYTSDSFSSSWIEQVHGSLATTLENISGSLPTEGKSRLISLGQYLLQHLFPTELQSDFRSLIPQNSTFTLLILADQEAWIPWELLYDGQRFFAERFIIGRWLQELNDTRPYEFPVGTVNVAHYANVEQPELWATLLEAPGAPLPQPLPAGVLHDSTEAMRGLHLIRYSQSSDAVNLRNAPVTLDNINDTEDIELQMRPAKLNLRRNRPFVTLSYVKTDISELTALENTWASAFIRAGCSGFTGSLWAVEPAVEAAFISCFYNRLWAGASLGEAFYTSRQLARASAPDSLDWLAYVLFGDPMARPYRPVPGDGYAIVEPIGREIDDPLSPGAIARFRVTLRRNPPVWHEDRVIEVAENLVFENLQVHIVTYGLQVIPDLPVTMTLTAKGDYLGWFTLVVPNEITDTSALVQVYFADGMRPIHSLNFSLNIENGREE